MMTCPRCGAEHDETIEAVRDHSYECPELGKTTFVPRLRGPSGWVSRR